MTLTGEHAIYVDSRLLSVRYRLYLGQLVPLQARETARVLKMSEHTTVRQRLQAPNKQQPLKINLILPASQVCKLTKFQVSLASKTNHEIPDGLPLPHK